MPIHVVVAHVAVILAPLSALLALAYAVRPGARAGLRWLLVASTAAALGAVVWAGLAGGALYTQLETAAKSAGAALPPEVFAHAHGSDVLSLAMLGLAVLVAALVWWLLAPGRPRTVPTLIAAAVLGVTALATLATTGLVLAQAIAAVWSHQTFYG